VIAAAGILVVVMAARMAGKSTVPVLDKAGASYVAALGVAA
jgi:hypothetical protein